MEAFTKQKSHKITAGPACRLSTVDRVALQESRPWRSNAGEEEGEERRGRTLTEARQRHLRLDPLPSFCSPLAVCPYLTAHDQTSRLLCDTLYASPKHLPACISLLPPIEPPRCRRNAPTTPTRPSCRSRTNSSTYRAPTPGAVVATAARTL